MTPTSPAIGTVVTRDVHEYVCNLCGWPIARGFCNSGCAGDRLTLRMRMHEGGYTMRCWRRVDTLVSEERGK